MKINTLLLGIAILLFAFASCNEKAEQKPEEMILGTWKITDFKSTADFEKDELTELKNDLMKNVTYTFTKDNLVRQYSDFKSDWTWELSDNAKKITLRGKDKTDEMTIIKITEDELIWKKEVANEYEETTTWKKQKSQKK